MDFVASFALRLVARSPSFVLREKQMQTKLELLFRKNLYNVALQLAELDGDKSLIADIYRKYGDHLYAKEDYDNAMEQYVVTIGEVEPSYVIRKFLDAQRIPSLASYLESLHHHSMANADHTTLLLNCYTKLKDVTKLDAFVHVEGTDVQPEDYVKRFDIDTAIKVRSLSQRRARRQAPWKFPWKYRWKSRSVLTVRLVFRFS